tara:strand:- start:4253 stop:5005 length:753 start_codon:yes stop_codon:yes gene_type:complete
MVEGSFAIAYGGFLYLKHLWQTWRSHTFGTYGTWGVGKTTLSRQLSTTGELEHIDPEDFDTTTHHPFDPNLGRYLPPPATRKRIAVHNTVTLGSAKRTIVSTDLGGHPKYFDLWLRDMVGRNVEVVIWMIDHRHLRDKNDTTQQDSFRRFVDCIVNNDYPFTERKMKKKAKAYKPLIVGLVANKADVWLDENWEKHWGTRRMNEHPIFEPFKHELTRLQRHLIPTIKRPMSALRNWEVESTIWDLLESKH